MIHYRIISGMEKSQKRGKQINVRQKCMNVGNFISFCDSDQIHVKIGSFRKHRIRKNKLENNNSYQYLL